MPAPEVLWCLGVSSSWEVSARQTQGVTQAGATLLAWALPPFRSVGRTESRNGDGLATHLRPGLLQDSSMGRSPCPAFLGAPELPSWVLCSCSSSSVPGHAHSLRPFAGSFPGRQHQRRIVSPSHGLNIFLMTWTWVTVWLFVHLSLRGYVNIQI